MDISILIPCYNEEKTIGACLKSCFAQTRKPDQILVVDDGSTDRTPQILKKFGRKIKVVRTSRNTGNKSRAQEFGLKYITGDVFVTTDADTILDRHFLERVEKGFKDKQTLAVAGYVKSTKHNWLTACREIDYIVSQHIHKEAQSYINAIYVVPGCSSAFKTELFRRYIEFDHDTLTEDLDFTYKIYENDFRIEYDPEAIVYTQDPATLKSYVRQMERWYSGGWQNLIKHRKLLFDRSPNALEITLAYSETVALSLMMFILPFINLWTFAGYLISFLGFSLIFSVYAAVISGRYDLLKYFPLHASVTVLNILLSFKTFVFEILLGRKNKTWFKPERRRM